MRRWPAWLTATRTCLEQLDGILTGTRQRGPTARALARAVEPDAPVDLDAPLSEYGRGLTRRRCEVGTVATYGPSLAPRPPTCDAGAMPDPIRGSCLCGGVRFAVNPPFIRANHCHCSRCRKHSGTAVCTQARVRREQFTLLQGEELIRVYGRGAGAVKAFCVACGSSLFGGDWPDGPQVSIRLGAFDDDPGVRPQFHTWVDSRAPWDEITDDLPQYPEGWSKQAAPR